MGSLGWPELLIIGLVLILLFGAKKLPEAAKGIGEGIRNFKASMKGETDEIKKTSDDIKKEVEKV
jgi:sec-independent protein translocase protein TatA